MALYKDLFQPETNEHPLDAELRAGSVLAGAQCYALVGTRTKDGKEETFRSPINPEKWYRLTNADKLMEAMRRNHPSWTWKIVSA